MAETLSAMEFRQRIGDLLNRVALRQDEFIISRKGRPLAALVPVDRLEQMRQAARLFLMDALPAKPVLSVREADRLGDEAKHRSRARRRK